MLSGHGNQLPVWVPVSLTTYLCISVLYKLPVSLGYPYQPDPQCSPQPPRRLGDNIAATFCCLETKTSTMMSKPNHLYLQILLVEITTWNKDPVLTCYLLEHMGSYK